jgi:hypothetical protein
MADAHTIFLLSNRYLLLMKKNRKAKYGNLTFSKRIMKQHFSRASYLLNEPKFMQHGRKKSMSKNDTCKVLSILQRVTFRLTKS